MKEKEFKEELDKTLQDIFAPVYKQQLELTEQITKAVGEAFYKGIDIGKRLTNSQE